ncbi:cytidine deaminase [Sporothrix brasiliensis 5110]|uniref:Cytidine deaminase n=1 Tax=Sporothrix brasiliensis 5110 TaxID=1398154 RepID=A0A0C2FAT1_9PEZI|nr:cytidine deaminase [Sporothrix brasiliensis 5110]KIH88163.1 cytidine deaminase [Sporothrix brasiliensis 5110]
MATIAVHSTADIAQVESTCRQLGITVEEFRELHRYSVSAAESAYCPYSNFPVGAAVMTKYGVQGPDAAEGLPGSGGNGHSRFILGANVENVSYPVGTCAERVALGRAVFEGHRDFKAIAVMAPAAAAGMPCSPCGMCRQFIREFCGLDLPVLMFAKDGQYIGVKLETLLPLSFGPDALGPR